MNRIKIRNVEESPNNEDNYNINLLLTEPKKEAIKNTLFNLKKLILITITKTLE